MRAGDISQKLYCLYIGQTIAWYLLSSHCSVKYKSNVKLQLILKNFYKLEYANSTLLILAGTYTYGMANKGCCLAQPPSLRRRTTYQDKL